MGTGTLHIPLGRYSHMPDGHTTVHRREEQRNVAHAEHAKARFEQWQQQLNTVNHSAVSIRHNESAVSHAEHAKARLEQWQIAAEYGKSLCCKHQTQRVSCLYTTGCKKRGTKQQELVAAADTYNSHMTHAKPLLTHSTASCCNLHVRGWHASKGNNKAELS